MTDDHDYQKVIARLDAIDRATALDHENMTRVPTEVDKQIKGLREVLERDTRIVRDLTNAHFDSITARLAERDMRFALADKDSKEAIDRAFAAQEKALDKAEGGMARQFEAVNRSVDDIKDRVVRIETRSGTFTEVRQRSNSQTGLQIAAAVAVVSIVELVLHFIH